MKLDHLEKLADEHESGYDITDDLVCDLLNNECNPFTEKNIITAIYEDCLFREADQFRFAELMEKREMTELGRFVYGRIVDYWERQAEELAEEQRAKSWGYEER